VQFYADQLYVLDAKAKYDGGSGRVTGKQTFNSTASSTYLVTDDDFAECRPYLDGKVGGDLVTIGELSANMSLQVTKRVSYMSDFDGTLGLGMSDALDGSSLVEQLAPQLDSPVITYHMQQPYFGWWSNSDTTEGSGVLSFGDLAPDTCNSATWTSLASTQIYYYPGLPEFNITSASRPAEEGACNSVVVANISVALSHLFRPLYVSYQMQQLFIEASGAKWDNDARAYVVDYAGKAQPVTLQLTNGASIQITPDDYLIEWYGVQQLYVVGFYDQNTQLDGGYFSLGQQFLNNRCLSMNINSGEWSIASVLQSAETVNGSTSSDY